MDGAALSNKPCKACGKLIPAMRLEMSPVTKTCSKACSQANHRKNLAETQARYYRNRKARRQREAATCGAT